MIQDESIVALILEIRQDYLEEALSMFHQGVEHYSTIPKVVRAAHISAMVAGLNGFVTDPFTLGVIYNHYTQSRPSDDVNQLELTNIEQHLYDLLISPGVHSLDDLREMVPNWNSQTASSTIYQALHRLNSKLPDSLRLININRHGYFIE